MAIPPQCFLITNLSNGDSSASVARWLTLHNSTLNCTALTRWTDHGRSSHMTSERTHREHRLHHLFYCCMTSPRTCMPRALHNNGCTRHVSWHLLYCSVWALPSNGWCLQSHFLATGLYATIVFKLTSNFTGLISWLECIISICSYYPRIYSSWENPQTKSLFGRSR
jgi:hypothetical protein